MEGSGDIGTGGEAVSPKNLFVDPAYSELPFPGPSFRSQGDAMLPPMLLTGLSGSVHCLCLQPALSTWLYLPG